MAELPYMSVHVADAIAADEGLTNEELGVLTRLRRVMWLAGGLIDVADIPRFARAGKRWGAIGPKIMKRLTVEGGKASCPVLMTRLAYTRRRRAQRIGAAAASAASRASAGHLNAISKGHLNAAKPLERHSLDVDLVGHPLARPGANQNQNQESNPKNKLRVPTTLSTQDLRAQQNALYRDGVVLLMERSRCTRLEATKNINVWLGMLDGDAKEVAALLARADAENFKGHAFERMVAQWVETVERERTKGIALPLGPSRKATAGGQG